MGGGEGEEFSLSFLREWVGSQRFRWERKRDQSGPTEFKGGTIRNWLPVRGGGGNQNTMESYGRDQVTSIVTQQNFASSSTFNNDFFLIMSIPVSIHATVYPVMISAPNKPTEAVTGETVSFKWHYNSGDLKNDLFEVVFGIWKSPGFLKTKLIAVNSSGFASTRSSYKSSVGWAGNLTSSVAVFELYNVKLEDGKTYGIVVEYGLQNTPLTDSIQLQVKSRRK